MPGYGDRVPRSLLSRRIVGAVAFAVVFGLACFLLGRWQWSRFEEKDVRATALEHNYSAAPVPLRSVLPQLDTELGEPRIWTHVTVTGRYAALAPLLVRNRTLDSALGYEVLAPFQVDGGGVLMVSRGWVPNGATATDLPTVPPTPLQSLTVTGWLKPGEPDFDRSLPAGQLASVNLDDAAAALGTPVYAAYLVLQAEAPTDAGAAPARPTALPAPEPDRGPHLAYAIQWWLTALLGVALLVMIISGRPGADDAQPERAPKPKKVRIWDEEDG